MRAAWTVGIVISLAAWTSVALAQLRGEREGIDTSSLAVVGGLFVLGVVAFFLARGR
jgi:hypothetical protein